MNILMLSSTFPYPPTKGGTHGRTFNLLKILARHHAITLIAQRTADVSEEEVEKLSGFVENLVLFPRPTEVNPSLVGKLQRFGQFLQKGTPPNVLFGYDRQIQDWIDTAVREKRFSVITSEHSVNEVYVRPEWKSQLRTVIDIHSSVYQTCKSQLAMGVSSRAWRDRLYLPLLRRYEQQSARKFSRIVVTTDEDERQMQAFVPDGEVFLIPNAVDLDLFTDRPRDPGGHSLVFVGGLDYFVNIDAACFLVREIFPRLREHYPDATVTLVGANPSAEVLALGEQPHVTVTGRVPSIVPYLHQATVAVLPLRTGFGMKFKTLESMAAGVPVVASDRGLEGLAVDGDNVPPRALRANRVEEYVGALDRLFASAELRATLSRNGRALIEENYTWERAGANYERVLCDPL